MEFKEIKDLLAQFNQSSLKEFRLREGNFEFYLSKNETNQQVVIEKKELSEDIVVPVSSVTPTIVEEVIHKDQEVNPIQVGGTEVVSPLVGVVYLKPAPEKEVFKKVGDRVEKGDVLCIVEAMKVMNEIISDVSGEIIEVLVENEQIVEYSQPLFKVKEG